MHLLSTEFSPIPDLNYPFGDRWHAPIAEPYQVSDGIYWLRMPLPIALDHINLWLLRDHDGWTIVDTGFDAPVCKQTWEQVFADFLSDQIINRIIVTHFHPDHIGLAAWLAEKLDVKIWMTRGEFDFYRTHVDRDREQYSKSVEGFVVELGLSSADQQSYLDFVNTGADPNTIRVAEEHCEFIADGDQIEIDGKSWQVVMGNGHSPEHACLYQADQGVLISGDQALPRISSNISVFFVNKDEDPLNDWLTSCEKLKTNIPSDTLVLPSHQEPFIGIDQRMSQLIADHIAQLNVLRNHANQSFTCAEACQLLYKRELNGYIYIFAISETLAHINYLVCNGELKQQKDDKGAIVYSAISD